MKPHLSHIRFKHESAHIDMVFALNGQVWLENAYAGEKRKKHGRECLIQITEFADREQLTLRLKAQRYGDDPNSPPSEKLVEMYKRHGFVIDESYLGSDPVRMIRKPQRKKGNE